MSSDDVHVKSVVMLMLEKFASGKALENEILQAIINYQKSTLADAQQLFREMKNLGLDICKDLGGVYYHIPQFALMRGWITEQQAHDCEHSMKNSLKAR